MLGMGTKVVLVVGFGWLLIRRIFRGKGNNDEQREF